MSSPLALQGEKKPGWSSGNVCISNYFKIIFCRILDLCYKFTNETVIKAFLYGPLKTRIQYLLYLQILYELIKADTPPNPSPHWALN